MLGPRLALALFVALMAGGLAASAIALPAAGLAAHSQKGGTYTGDLAQTPTRSAKHVVVRVSANGKRARARLNCSTTRAGTTRRFRISSSGRFKGSRKVGSQVVWRIRGRFTSKDKARAKLYLPSVCDGRGGRITLERKAGSGGGSTRPTKPVPFSKDTVFTLNGAQGTYWVYVPSSYNASHTTPIPLLAWSHGCGGQSAGDISTVSPGGSQSYIAIAPGGREGQCWDPNSDQPKLLGAIADVKTHFNIDRRRVVLGGYSSGGDLSYRTAFYNSRKFAGLLAENTSPFRDTGSSQSASLAAAKFKFHVVHLAHTEDEAYPIEGVRQETDAMKDAGFPISRVERPGSHFDEDAGDTGTDHDLRTILLPHMNDGWRSP